MNNCENCGREIINGTHCQDCQVAHLALEVEKERDARKNLSKWLWVVVVLLVILGVYIITR